MTFVHPSTLLLHWRGGLEEELSIEDEEIADDELDAPTVATDEHGTGVVIDVVSFKFLCFEPLWMFTPFLDVVS